MKTKILLICLVLSCTTIVHALDKTRPLQVDLVKGMGPDAKLISSHKVNGFTRQKPLYEGSTSMMTNYYLELKDIQKIFGRPVKISPKPTIDGNEVDEKHVVKIGRNIYVSHMGVIDCLKIGSLKKDDNTVIFLINN